MTEDISTILNPAYVSDRSDNGKLRYGQAMSYVWGREDAGDDALTNVLSDLGATRDAAHIFATYSANEADAYARQERTSLSNIRDQYEALVRTLRFELSLRYARLLGADAALSAVTWVELSDDAAESILSDCDPQVLDAIRVTNLSGE